MRRILFVLRLHAGGLSIGLGLFGCGEAEVAPDFGPYASRVVDFAPGPSAGFGQDALPDVVLGPPRGTFDVLSLGVGGSITLGFAFEIVDANGPDFVVFENAFLVSGSQETFAEPGRVEVSEDGEVFVAFECEPGLRPFDGCAGVQPTGTASLEELSADRAGGDPFDLAEVGLSAIRFIRIVDTSTRGEGTTAGFDLDAVGAFHRSGG